jgi:RNA polymerase sigma factor (sigma-70 family)
MLLRKCERILRNRDDAEDVVQALFVELLKRKSTNVDLPYLYRACTNRCLNLIRNRKRRRQLLEQEKPNIKLVTIDTADERAIGLQKLALLVKRLDKKSSEILVYRYLDDMTQSEIGQVTGFSRKTIGKRLKKIESEVRKVNALGPGDGGRP